MPTFAVILVGSDLTQAIWTQKLELRKRNNINSIGFYYLSNLLFSAVWCMRCSFEILGIYVVSSTSMFSTSELSGEGSSHTYLRPLILTTCPLINWKYIILTYVIRNFGMNPLFMDVVHSSVNVTAKEYINRMSIVTFVNVQSFNQVFLAQNSFGYLNSFLMLFLLSI